MGVHARAYSLIHISKVRVMGVHVTYYVHTMYFFRLTKCLHISASLYAVILPTFDLTHFEEYSGLYFAKTNLKS